MHIPDGYLGPQTYAPAWAFMLLVWGWASRVIKQTLKSYQVPLLAIGAAFSFVIMMFNIPIPGGTTGHAVGGVLVAIVLGPWAAVVAISVALIVQALLFGDGGITAIGANCFNMALVLPFVGYWTYRLLAARSSIASPRRAIAAAAGGYVGLNAAALTTALMFGIQPIIAHAPSGQPLYSPYPLSVAVPAMALEHLLLFGFIEAAATGLVVAYLQRTDVSLLQGGMLRPSAAVTAGGLSESAGPPRATLRRLWIGLAVLALLTPIGLIVPAWLKSGDAWGEWSAGQIKNLVGYVPRGMQGLQDKWRALLPDYAVGGLGSSVGYVVSAIVGILVVAAAAWILAAALRRRERGSDEPPGQVPRGEAEPASGGVAAAREPGAHAAELRDPPRIPQWLGADPETSPLDTGVSQTGATSRRRADFVERTLREIVSFVREALFIERWAQTDGPLQRVDPRAKIVCAALVILLASLVHRQPILWGLYALVFAVAVFTRIPAGLFIKRVWLFVPLFTGLVVLPATLNVITPGQPLVVLFSPGLRQIGPWVLPRVISITRPGVDAALLVVARVATSVSVVVLLSLTTRWSDLLKALRSMRLSAVFLMAMEMSYRYVFVLVTMVEDTYLAKRARTIARASAKSERRWVGSRLGATALRSRRLTEAVYQAMLARGYDGEPRTVRALNARAVDWVLVGSASLISALLLIADRWVT